MYGLLYIACIVCRLTYAAKYIVIFVYLTLYLSVCLGVLVALRGVSDPAMCLTRMGFADF